MTGAFAPLRQYRREAREALEAAALAELEHDWRAVARLLLAAAHCCTLAHRAAVTISGEARP